MNPAGQRIQQYVRDDLLASLHKAHVQILPTVRLFGADEAPQCDAAEVVRFFELQGFHDQLCGESRGRH